MADNLKTYPYDNTLQAQSGGGTYDELEIEPQPAGGILSVENITVTDIENGATRFDILVGPYGIERRIHSSAALSADTPIHYTEGFYVRDTERLLIRVYGATRADTLIAVVRGEVQYKGAQAVELEVNH